MSAQLPSFGPIDLRAVQIDLQRLVDLLEVKGRGRGFDLSTAIVPVVDVGQIMELAGDREGFLRPFVSPSEIPFRQAPVTGTPELPATARGFTWFIFSATDAADVTDLDANIPGVPVTNAAGFPAERALVRVAAVAAFASWANIGQAAHIYVTGTSSLALTFVHEPSLNLFPAFGAPFPQSVAFVSFSPPQRVIPNGGSWQIGPGSFLRVRRTVRVVPPNVVTTGVHVLAQIAPAVD